MKLKIITNGKTEQGYALIGITGSIRLKKPFAQMLSFVKNERWIIGTDEQEIPIKHIYIIKPDKENEQFGFKMQFANDSWSLAGKTVVKELGLQVPLKCKVEVYEDEKHNGFRLILP